MSKIRTIKIKVETVKTLSDINDIIFLTGLAIVPAWGVLALLGKTYQSVFLIVSQ